MRMASSGCKLRLRRAHHLIAEIPAQVAGGAEIDPAPAEKPGQIDFDLRHCQQARGRVRFEFHQQVHIAVRPVGVFQRGAEQRQPPDAVAPANLGQGGVVIKGVAAPYDRVVVHLSHVADEAHYLGASDIITGAPAVQWTILFGTGHVRLYATTAIPTGLYRFGNATGSGVLSLSVAVITRLTWLDNDGHEGLLGLEGGIMAFGFTNGQAQALTEVGVVAGVGLSIPLAGAGSPTQASINLHAWVEQRISQPTTAVATIAVPNPPNPSARAVIVGPSISFGNIGTTF